MKTELEKFFADAEAIGREVPAVMKEAFSFLASHLEAKLGASISDVDSEVSALLVNPTIDAPVEENPAS